MEKRIYLDNAATTKTAPEVVEAMLPYFTEHYGNPSSIYSIGREARKAIEIARQKVASAIGAQPTEIYFTGSGTESDNWALKGVMESARAKGKTHLITTAFEHHAVLHSAQKLEKQGFTVTYLPVSPEGYVSPEQVRAAITEQTALVSVMYANSIRMRSKLWAIWKLTLPPKKSTCFPFPGIKSTRLKGWACSIAGMAYGSPT